MAKDTLEQQFWKRYIRTEIQREDYRVSIAYQTQSLAANHRASFRSSILLI
jgi:hypothetical protein